MIDGMRLFVRVVMLLCALLPAVSQEEKFAASPDFAKVLSFEGEHTTQAPFGWRGRLANIAVDENIKHGGRWSARLEGDPYSIYKFVPLTYTVPVNFKGRKIELRGFLRMEDVTGFAALWIREDGRSGAVAFDNMQSRNLHGTHDWKEYSIVLPLKGSAQSISFGALVASAGTLWVDDLQLFVDGKPLWETPLVEVHKKKK